MYALDTPTSPRHHGDMSEETLGEYERLALRAAGLAEHFAGHNVASANGTIHALGNVPYEADLQRPGPYCHIGVTGKLRRTKAPVTCLRCLNMLNLTAEPRGPVPLAGLDSLMAQLAVA